MTTVNSENKAMDKMKLRSTLTALGMLPVLVILALGFHFLSGRFLSVNNLSIVMQQASINTVLAAGMTFVILTGGIDLSVGSILAASAMVGVLVSLIQRSACSECRRQSASACCAAWRTGSSSPS
jgi:ribose transport system permease protein